MKCKLLLIFSLWCGICFAQKRKLVPAVSDTTIVTDTMVVGTRIAMGDTSYFIKTNAIQKNWMVYYDKTRTQPAYYLHHKDTSKINDSISTKSWYHGGKVKSEVALYKRDHVDRFSSNEWYADGGIKKIRTYYKAGDSCVTKEFYPGGQLSRKLLEKIDSSSGLQIDPLYRSRISNKNGAKIHYRYLQICYCEDYYENGKPKHDPYNPIKASRVISYYPSGAKKFQCNYVSNVIDSAYTEWWENGKIKTEGTYETPEPISLKTKSGTRTPTKIISTSPLKTGVWTYYNSDGKRIKEETYVDGNLSGAYKEWYESKSPNEQLKLQGYYTVSNADSLSAGISKKFVPINSVKSGTWFYYNSFYANDSTVESVKIKEENYVNGNLYGPYKEWWSESGKLRVTGTYKTAITQKEKDGKKVVSTISVKDSTWKYYCHSDSILLKEEHYSIDKLVGSYKEWYANGKVRIQGNYDTLKFVKNGEWDYYNKHGRRIKKEMFVEGNLIKKPKFKFKAPKPPKAPQAPKPPPAPKPGG